MPDTPERDGLLPKRIWLTPLARLIIWPNDVHEGDVPYVPESALRDAEREREVLAKQLERRADGMDPLTEQLRARVAALTADKEALVPLMQAVDAMAWTAGANVPPGIHFTTAKELGEFLSVLNAARRIVEGT